MISFSVLGKPVGKGRPRFSTANGFPRSYTPQKTVEFENLVRLMFPMDGYKMEGNITVVITAVFPIPKSVSKKKRAALIDAPYPHKPDCDNICKSVLDALNGIAYDDDSQVTMVVVRKKYGETPCTEVTMYEEHELDDCKLL